MFSTATSIKDQALLPEVWNRTTCFTSPGCRMRISLPPCPGRVSVSAAAAGGDPFPCSTAVLDGSLTASLKDRTGGPISGHQALLSASSGSGEAPAAVGSDMAPQCFQASRSADSIEEKTLPVFHTFRTGAIILGLWARCRPAHGAAESSCPTDSHRWRKQKTACPSLAIRTRSSFFDAATAVRCCGGEPERRSVPSPVAPVPENATMAVRTEPAGETPAPPESACEPAGVLASEESGLPDPLAAEHSNELS